MPSMNGLGGTCPIGFQSQPRPPTSPFLRILGLSPATGYHYRVRAVNGTESSVFSNAVLAGTPGIQPPTELRASALSNDDDYAISNFEIGLDWEDNSYNDTGFILQRRLDDSLDWVAIAFTAPRPSHL